MKGGIHTLEIVGEWFHPFIAITSRSNLIPSRSTGVNDKIDVLKKTTQQLYFKTFIEKINSGNLIM